MKPSIYVKRQSFEVRLNSVISFVFVAFCQPRILRYSARDVTDIFAIFKLHVESQQYGGLSNVSKMETRKSHIK